MRGHRIRPAPVLLALVVVLLSAGFASCPKQDTSQLDPIALSQLRETKALKVTDDVTTAVMGAYRSGKLSRDLAGQILGYNKQARDAIKANPQSWREAVPVVLKNIRDALTPEQHLTFDPWLDLIEQGLRGIR